MARRRMTPDERIYWLKHDNRGLRAEIRMLQREHRADKAQLRSQYRAGIKRLIEKQRKLKKT